MVAPAGPLRTDSTSPQTRGEHKCLSPQPRVGLTLGFITRNTKGLCAQGCPSEQHAVREQGLQWQLSRTPVPCSTGMLQASNWEGSQHLPTHSPAQQVPSGRPQTGPETLLQARHDVLTKQPHKDIVAHSTSVPNTGALGA